MPRATRSQLTVELAPAVKRQLEDIVAAGETLSPQDFIRRAIEEKLERYKTAHGGQIPLAPGTVTVPERRPRREGER